MKKIAFLVVLVLLVVGGWIVWRFAPIHSGPFIVEGKLGNAPAYDAGKSRFVLFAVRSPSAHRYVISQFVGSNGFVFRDVPAGDYDLISDLRDGDGMPVGEAQPIHISIPARSRNPIPLPPLVWHAFTVIRVGDVAPEYAFSTPDGKSHVLSELRGKWVLLAFHQEGRNIDLSAFEAAQAAYGKRKDFAAVTLDMADGFAPRHFPWIEGYTGPIKRSDFFPPFGLMVNFMLVDPRGVLAADSSLKDEALAALAAKLPPEPAPAKAATPPAKPKKK